MSTPSVEEFVIYLNTVKPYLVELEKAVQELDYGELDVRLTVRAGVVEKMTFITSKTWLKK